MTSDSALPSLYQVVVRQPGREPATVSLAAFPFVIGRAPAASLPLDGPGIWPRHLGLELAAGEGLVVTVEPGAIATLDDKPIGRHRVRHGDEVRVGGIRLQFLVSPPARRSLTGWETALWVLLAGIVLAQILVAWRIPHD